MERYEYSVIEVATKLHCAVTGTGVDGLYREDEDILIPWLEWRLENWKPTCLDRNGIQQTEAAIYLFAKAALASYKDCYKRSQQEEKWAEEAEGVYKSIKG
jgi:hypothetical protein